MTERIYYLDSYCREFCATVVSCTENNDCFEIILDKTAFFPEGGGQASDTGYIDGIEIFDVQENGETIVHKSKKSISEGKKVSCSIDWEKRYVRMQNHSGEHIISGIVHSMFGYTNSGFHMTDSLMTVDFSGPLTDGDIRKIETESNLAIYKNALITSSFPTKEEADKIEYRSKLDIESGLRLITIDGIDCCACCAPHVKYTGEIGMIKILDFAPHRKGTRLQMIAGLWALEDYINLHSLSKSLMKHLSSPRNEIYDAVIKQTEQITELKASNGYMAKKLALLELNPITVGEKAYALCENLSYDGLRHCANSLMDKGIKECILFSKAEENSYLYVVCGVSEVTETVKKINSLLNGKGGGRGNFAQGKATAESDDILKKEAEKILA